MPQESNTITIQFRGESTKLVDEVNNIDRTIKYLQYDTAALQKKIKFGGKYEDQMDLYAKAISNVDEEVRLAMTNMYKWDDEVESYGKTLRENGHLTAAENKNMQHAIKMYNEYVKKVANLREEYGRLTNEKENYNRLKVASWLDEEGKKFGKLGQGLDRVAESFKYLSLGAGAALTASATAAISFETAMANVNKVLRESEKDYLGTLRDQILDMSRVLPLTAQEIAQVTANALQLGISAKDVGKFTETILKLGTATNISADEAAIAIAQLFNITGEQFDNIDKFGAALTNLGNKFPTFESNIVEMSQKIGAAGSSIGMTTADILGLSTALASMGLSADAGATAISTILRNIDTAVATNSKEVAKWAKQAGMSSQEFREAWEGNVTGTFQNLVNSISESVQEGENLNVIMSDLGINAVRQKDAFSRLVQASDTLNDALYESKNAWDALARGEEGALNTEFAEKVNTLANQFQLLKNELYYVGVQLGDLLMPALREIVNWVRDLVNWFANLSPTAKQWITNILVGIAAIYPAFKGLATAVRGIEKLFRGLGAVLGSKILPDKFGETFFKTLLNVVPKVASKLALPVAAIAALAAAFAHLYKSYEPFKMAIDGLVDSFKGKLIAYTGQLIYYLKELGNWLAQRIVPIFKMVHDMYKRFIEPTLAYLFSAITKLVFDVIVTLYKWIVKVITYIGEAVKPVIDVILGVIKAVIGILTPVIGAIIRILGVVIEFCGVLWNLLKPYLEKVIDILGEACKWVGELAKWIEENLGFALQTGIDMFANLFSYLENTGVVDAFVKAFDAIVGVFKTAWEWLEKLINGLNSWAGNAPTLDQMRRDYENQTGQRVGSTGVINNYFTNNQRNTFNGNTSQQTVAAANNMIDLINNGLGKKLTF